MNQRQQKRPPAKKTVKRQQVTKKQTRPLETSPKRKKNIKRFPKPQQPLSPAAQRLQEKKLRQKMRKRRQRRRILMLVLALAVVVAGIVFGTKLLFQVNGVRLEIGEDSFYYPLPMAPKEQTGSQSQPQPTPSPSEQPPTDSSTAESTENPPSPEPTEPPQATPTPEDGSQAVTTAFHFVADEAQPEQSQSEQTQPEETPVPEPNSQPKETPAPDKEPIMHQGATEVTLEQPIAEQRYSVGDVIDILKLNAGDNLLDIDLNHLKQSIEETLPYLENVTVKYRLPNTIVVRADIAQPTYTVQTEAGWVLLSAHQKVLELVDQQPTDKKVLVLGKVSTEVGKQLVFEPDIKPVDEGAILGQTNLTEAERLKQLEQARQDAETEANEQAEKRKNDLNLLLELLNKWGLTEHITTIDVADEMELQVWYQGRILTKLGTDNQLDYKIQFAAEILTKQLSASDKGQLDVSNIREDGELRPVFSRTIS